MYNIYICVYSFLGAPSRKIPESLCGQGEIVKKIWLGNTDQNAYRKCIRESKNRSRKERKHSEIEKSYAPYKDPCTKEGLTELREQGSESHPAQPGQPHLQGPQWPYAFPSW